MKLSKKTIAIIIVALIAVAGTVVACLFFFTDTFKSEEEMFFQYIEKAALPETANSYQEILDELQATSTKSYKANFSIGVEAEMKNSGYYYRSQQKALNELSNMKINVGVNSKPSEEKASYDIDLKYDDKSLASGQIVRNGDLYAVKSDLLDEKYIAIKNDNLKDLARKLGINSSDIPDKLAFLDIYKLLYISKDDQEYISKTYNNALVNSFPKENFSKADNVSTKVNGVQKNTTTYTLSVSQKDFYNAVKNILQTAKNDDRTLNIVTEKFNTLLNESLLVKTAVTNYSTSYTYGDRYSSTISDIGKEDIKEVITKLLNQIESKTRYTSTTIIDVVVYVENGKTVKIDLKQGDDVGISIEFYESNGKNHIVLYTQISSYNSRTYSYENTLTKVMEIQYQITKNGNYKKTDVEMIAYDTYYQEEQGRIRVEVVSDGITGVGTNKKSIKYTIETEEMSFTVNMDGTIEYTDNIEVPTVDSKNANIINDMTSTQIEELANKIMNTVQTKGQTLVDALEVIFSSNKSMVKNSLLDF